MTKDEKLSRRDMLKLRLRLLNCLQTILELEPAVSKFCPEGFLAREFSSIRSFVAAMEEWRLEEHEVTRIESATKIFLKELRLPPSCSPSKKSGVSRFIQ